MLKRFNSFFLSTNIAVFYYFVWHNVMTNGANKNGRHSPYYYYARSDEHLVNFFVIDIYTIMIILFVTRISVSLKSIKHKPKIFFIIITKIMDTSHGKTAK